MSIDPLPASIIIIDLIIILLNAYFAAARRAISSVNKAQMREHIEENKTAINPLKAKTVLDILDNPADYKFAIRCLNVFLYMLLLLSNVVISINVHLFGGTLFTSWVNSTVILDEINTDITGLMLLLNLIVIWIISGILILALGEMLPRKIAVQHDESIVLSTATKVKAVRVLFKPVMLCAVGISFLFLKLFRQRTDVNDNEYSEEDIVEMLEVGQESGILKEENKNMITGVFAFDDLLAYEIMTPRTDVFAIDINDPAEEYIDELMELRYSRIPVYEDDSDNIIGILHIKDYLIKAWEDGFENVDIRSILRDPYLIPETKNIDSLFVELQKTRQHIAILIDEYGGFCGIVTMEDIIEEVMGDIDDEYDEEKPEITVIGDNLYLLDGGININDLNKDLDINLVSEDSETIGGFIIDMFGEIPTSDDVGREIYFENYVFTIKAVKDRRIEEVAMKILPVEEE